MCRTVFQAWFHSEDVAKPVCIVTINESFADFVEWVHVDEQYRRQGIATDSSFANKRRKELTTTHRMNRDGLEPSTLRCVSNHAI